MRAPEEGEKTLLLARDVDGLRIAGAPVERVGKGLRQNAGRPPSDEGHPFTTRHEQPGLGRQQIERLSGGGEPCERSRRGSPDAFAGSHDEVSLVSRDRLDGRL